MSDNLRDVNCSPPRQFVDSDSSEISFDSDSSEISFDCPTSSTGGLGSLSTGGLGSPSTGGLGSPPPDGLGSPSPDGLGSPSTGGLGSPPPDGLGSPSPDGLGSPSPNGLCSPSTDGLGSPSTGGLGSPPPGGLGSPSTGGLGSPPPDGLGSPSPDGLGFPSPDGLGSPSPDGLGSPSPDGLGSPSPDGLCSPSIGGLGSPSPDGLGSPSTRGLGSPSPGGLGSPSPGGLGSPSPDGLGSPSTGGLGFPSPGGLGYPPPGFDFPPAFGSIPFGSDCPPPGFSLSSGGVDPSSGGVDPSSGGVGPSSGGVGPSSVGVGPSSGGVGPSSVGVGPSSGGVGPSSVGVGPSSGGVGPSSVGVGPSSGGVGPSSVGVSPSSGDVGPSSGDVGPSSGGVDPSSGDVDPSSGGVGPSSGGVGPSSVGVGPSSGGVGPSTTGPFTASLPRNLLNKILERSDNKLIKETKSVLKCYNSFCLTRGTGRSNGTHLLHYHCSKCPQYRDKCFFRTVKHNLICKHNVLFKGLERNHVKHLNSRTRCSPLTDSFPGSSGSPGGLGSPSPGRLNSSSTGGLGSPSPGGLGSPSTGGLGSPSPGGLGSPSPGELGSPSPGGLGSPSPGGLDLPSSGGLSSPSPGGLGSPPPGFDFPLGSDCLPPGSSPPAGDPAGSSPPAGDPAGSSPLAGDPAGSGAPAGDPAGSSPLAGDPAGSGASAGSSPLAGDPAGSSPPAGDSAGSSPLAGDPAGSGASAGDPAGSSPPAGDSAGSSPLAGDPAGSGASAGDPAGSSPPAGDPAGSSPSAGDPAGSSPPLPGGSGAPSRIETVDIVMCKEAGALCSTAKKRKFVKHYHCILCPNKFSHVSRDRVQQHWIRCKGRLARQAVKMKVEPRHKNSLQSVLIHDDIYLVERAPQGPDNPVHCKASRGGSFCSDPVCQDIFNFEGSSLNEAFNCNHINACFNNIPTPQDDLMTDLSLFNIDQFGPDAKESVTRFVNSARSRGVPVIKQYIPELHDRNRSSRHIYYSVYSGTDKISYNSHYNRVVVSFDRNTKKHKCTCSDRKKSCIHKKVALLVSEKNPAANIVRPECGFDKVEVERVKRQMSYLIECKTIPFDVSSHLTKTLIKSFTPSETDCKYCSVPLIHQDTHNRGFIYTLDNKLSNIRVDTKKCPSCNLVYRYSDYNNGYFNYNNSSFFSLRLLELVLASWANCASLQKFLDTFTHVTKIDYNVHHILDAAKAYLALKELSTEKNMSCTQCSDYPTFLSFDVTRKVNFKVSPDEVDEENAYQEFKNMDLDCSMYNLSRCFLNSKSPQYTSNIEQFSMKLSPNLPSLICPNNYQGLSQYTRPLIQNDRPEEFEIPLERLEQMAGTSKGRSEIKKICQKLKLETKGGIRHQISRINLSSGNGSYYTSIRKNFSSLVGKSGGVLRGCCPHGIVYILKFLTLPESVADVTEVVTSMKIPCTFAFSDMAGMVANHTNNHHPDFFYPYGGKFDCITNPLSDLYKTGDRKAQFSFKTYATSKIDINKYNHTTAHPINKLIGRYIFLDRFHLKNHHSLDRHLRDIDNTNLEGFVNTQSVEQQNHKLGMERSITNIMDINTHIKFITYYTCHHNNLINEKWKKKMEKSCKVACEVDELGFLVKSGVTKSSVNNNLSYTAPTSSTPIPQAILQDPSGQLANINSVLYLLAFSPLADYILSSTTLELDSYKQILNYIHGKSVYDQAAHVRLSQKILGNINDPAPTTTIILSSLYQSLRSVGVILVASEVSSLNAGVALANCLGHGGNRDFVFLCKPNGNSYFSESKLHYDIGNSKYILIGFTKSSSCCILYDSVPYELISTNMTLLTRDPFLAMSRSADVLLYRLVDSSLSSSNSSSQFNIKVKAHKAPNQDVFDYQENNLNRKRKKVSQGSQPNSKRKVDPTVNFNAPSSVWRTHDTTTGRLTLHTEQQKICSSVHLWYDDIIMNSYSAMCRAQRNTFTYQDTLLGTPYFRGFASVDSKFIQILNLSNNHWLCASNALTYRNEPHIVELFDSLVHPKYFKAGGQLHSMLSKCILQIRPLTTCVRYVLTQRQTNGNDCGPLALGFLWSLSMGHHPLQYDHLQAFNIRGKVRESFNNNTFAPPCRSSPRDHLKKIIKTFELDHVSGLFTAIGGS